MAFYFHYFLRSSFQFLYIAWILTETHSVCMIHTFDQKSFEIYNLSVHFGRESVFLNDTSRCQKTGTFQKFEYFQKISMQYAKNIEELVNCKEVPATKKKNMKLHSNKGNE